MPLPDKAPVLDVDWDRLESIAAPEQAQVSAFENLCYVCVHITRGYIAAGPLLTGCPMQTICRRGTGHKS